MKKSDNSIRNITITKIKRSLMPSAVCKFTKTYETELMADIQFAENIITEELPIACTHVDHNNYTLVTTRRVMTRSNGSNFQVLFKDIRAYKFGDFKGTADNPLTVGSLTNIADEHIPLLIESGTPSMIIVNAIGTVLNLTDDLSS